MNEVDDILQRIEDGASSLRDDIALPFLQRVRLALKEAEEKMPAYRAAVAHHRKMKKRPKMVGDVEGDVLPPEKPSGQILPLACALGTAVLLKPRGVDGLFKKPDSDRIDHHMFGWPLEDVKRFDAPIPMNGAQGFWNCSIKEAA